MGILPIKMTSGNIETYEALFLQLPDPPEVATIDQIELSFGDVTQVFPTAFALMAVYVARHRGPKSHPVVLRRFGANPQSAKLERVMDAIGFLPAVAGRGPSVAKEGSGVVPLTMITPQTSPNAIAELVIDTVCLTAQPTRDAKEMMYVVVSEVLENIVQHAAATSPAFLCGQLSAQKRKLELCIVDAGVGLKQSFIGGKDPSIAQRIKEGESALYVALEPGTTSKGEGQTGLGLFVASEAARLTSGTFRLTSGNETVISTKEGEKGRTHAPWPGTIVNFMLNIDKLGSIADVYGELPLTRGKNDRFLAR